MFKNKKEMWEALLAGNTLIDKFDCCLYVDLNSTHGPIVFRSRDGMKSRANTALDNTSFSIQGIPKPKQGDKVLVWDNDKSRAVEKIYLTTVPNALYPIKVVSYDEEELLKNPTCVVTGFKYMEPLPQTYTITIDGKEITISEESYAALKESLTKGDK